VVVIGCASGFDLLERQIAFWLFLRQYGRPPPVFCNEFLLGSNIFVLFSKC
jgi:hypothetical protein